ncbi:MAG: hypothetical protein QXO30_08020 [Candidatus Caldarchaeum sp.]
MRKQVVKPNDTSLRVTIKGAETWPDDFRRRINEGFGLKAEER